MKLASAVTSSIFLGALCNLRRRTLLETTVFETEGNCGASRDEDHSFLYDVYVGFDAGDSFYDREGNLDAVSQFFQVRLLL